MPVCLILANAVLAMLPSDTFVLAWTHSVEKTEWREEWRVDEASLVLVEASVAGSGAGMEAQDGAQLRGGMWRWRPRERREARLLVANSAYGGDYRLCWQNACQTLAELLPGRADGPVEISPCVRHAADPAFGSVEEKKQ